MNLRTHLFVTFCRYRKQLNCPAYCIVKRLCQEMNQARQRFLAVLWIRNDFFLIRILLFRWIRILILHEFLKNIFNINFILVLPACKCWDKNDFFNWAFLLRSCQIYQFIRALLLQVHFEPGAARIRNDFFRIRILLKVSDPTGSGSTTLVLS